MDPEFTVPMWRAAVAQERTLLSYADWVRMMKSPTARRAQAPKLSDKRFGDKPWLLFAGDTYYPVGGMFDFQSAHGTEMAAMAAITELSCDWFQVHDIASGTTRHYGRQST